MKNNNNIDVTLWLFREDEYHNVRLPIMPEIGMVVPFKSKDYLVTSIRISPISDASTNYAVIDENEQNSTHPIVIVLATRS